MPVKTLTDSFSEEKIYPGHCVQFVRRDGKMFQFLKPKYRRYLLANRRALKYRWTKTWRRAHKKESILRTNRKGGKKKTLKSERGVKGMSIQDLMLKKEATADERQKMREAAKGRKAATGSKAEKKADLKGRLRALRQKKKQEASEKEKGAAAKKKAGSQPDRKKAADGGAAAKKKKHGKSGKQKREKEKKKGRRGKK